LTPPEAPISRTRAERFDDLVGDEVQRLAQRWARELAGVEFAVEEVPPPVPGFGLGGEASWFDGPDQIPLGRLEPATGTAPPRIVVYRRVLEARGTDERERARLVRDVIVEEVADLLGLSPESIDPSYDAD
jgi:predicted Zn-dependent protease with MMP-like domain